MTNLKEAKVGDIVVLRDSNEARRGGPWKVAVTKVGRTLLRVEGDSRGFGRDNGKVRDSYGHSRLQTVEEFENEEAADKARSALRKFGVEVSYGMNASKMLAIYKALSPLMNGDG